MGAADGTEFEMYVNDRRNSFVKDGVLYIKPTLTTDVMTEENMKTGTFKLDNCTFPNNYGCERDAAAGGEYINPVRSARLRTIHKFDMKYGRLEVRAQLPKGDWLWPAIWMLPSDTVYGYWPKSGEIDIMEARGNAPSCPGGRNTFGSTLHYGAVWNKDAWQTAHADDNEDIDLSDDFHNYGLEWDQHGIRTTIDGKTVLNFEHKEAMCKVAKISEKDCPWNGQPINAPFNQKFHIILNVAVGGNNGYFADNKCDKPWGNFDNKPSKNDFWDKRSQWLPSWNLGSNDAAMKIDYVKAWQTVEEPAKLQNLMSSPVNQLDWVQAFLI